MSHDNDAKRAVMCSLDLVARLKRMGLTASVGVTTGSAFCGVLGSQTRKEYSVLGDTVNLSARLMQYVMVSGPLSRVVCDENTYLVTKDDIAYGDGKRIKVKGKNIPVRIFEPKSVEIDAEKSHRLMALSKRLNSSEWSARTRVLAEAKSIKIKVEVPLVLNKMFFRKNGSMRHLADVDEAATSPTGGPSTPPQQVYKMPNKKHSVSMGEAAESLRPKILTHKRSNTDISSTGSSSRMLLSPGRRGSTNSSGGSTGSSKQRRSTSRFRFRRLTATFQKRRRSITNPEDSVISEPVLKRTSHSHSSFSHTDATMMNFDNPLRATARKGWEDAMDENIRHGETMDFEVNVRSVETFKDFQKLCWDHVKEQMGIAQNVDVENISLVLKGSEVMLPNEDFLSTHHHYLNEQHSMLGPGEEAYPAISVADCPFGEFFDDYVYEAETGSFEQRRKLEHYLLERRKKIYEQKQKRLARVVLLVAPVRDAALMQSGTARIRQRLLEHKIALIHKKQGSVVIIEGEMGSGKTSILCGFLEKTVPSQRCKVLCASGDPFDGSKTKFAVWYQALRSWLATFPAEENPPSIIKRYLKASLHAYIYLLKDGLELNDDDFDRPPDVTLARRQEQTIVKQILLSLFENMCARDKPTIVLIDDALHMDGASWGIAEEIGNVIRDAAISEDASKTFPFMLVVAVRPFRALH